MEYQKIIYFQTIHQINQLNLGQNVFFEKNIDASGTYDFNSKMKFKTSMLNSIVCDYSDAYILVSGTIISKRGSE